MELLVIDIFECDVDKILEDELLVEEISGMVDDVIGDMISIGILSDFLFGGIYIDVLINGKVEEIDWGKFVLFKFGGDFLVDFDWSQLLVFDFGGGVDDFDWFKFVLLKLGGGGLEDLLNGFDWSQFVLEMFGGIGLDGINGSYDIYDVLEVGKESLVDNVSL